MNVYLLREVLTPSSLEEIKNEKYQYAAVLSQEEWAWQNAGIPV